MLVIVVFSGVYGLIGSLATGITGHYNLDDTDSRMMSNIW